jgi:hypothetical protein
VPTSVLRSFRAYDVRYGPHADRSAAKSSINQQHLELDGRARLNTLRVEEENSIGADVFGTQRVPFTVLAGNALHAQ